MTVAVCWLSLGERRPAGWQDKSFPVYSTVCLHRVSGGNQTTDLTECIHISFSEPTEHDRQYGKNETDLGKTQAHLERLSDVTRYQTELWFVFSCFSGFLNYDGGTSLRTCNAQSGDFQQFRGSRLLHLGTSWEVRCIIFYLESD